MKNILPITIVIPHRNRINEIKVCVKSIQALSPLPSKVHIIDDFSDAEQIKNLRLYARSEYDENNELAVQFRNVAKLISGGLQTNIYILNVNGFDTHGSQVDELDATAGEHADLLKAVSDGISAFQDDLKLLNLEERVIGMTFSEFGRQIASNASYGTDHGDAAPLIMFGACLDFTVYGNTPDISNTIIKQEAVPLQIDFRDIYASVLKDWFGVPTSEIQALFEQSINYHSLISCKVDLGLEEDLEFLALNIFPNPTKEKLTINYHLNKNEEVTFEIVDLLGKKVKSFVVFNSSGNNTIDLDISELPSANYVLQFHTSEVTESLKFTISK